MYSTRRAMGLAPFDGVNGYGRYKIHNKPSDGATMGLDHQTWVYPEARIPPGGRQGLGPPPGGGQCLGPPPGGDQGLGPPPGEGQCLGPPPGGGHGLGPPPGGGQGLGPPPGEGQCLGPPPGGGHGLGTPRRGSSTTDFGFHGGSPSRDRLENWLSSMQIPNLYSDLIHVTPDEVQVRIEMLEQDTRLFETESGEFETSRANPQCETSQANPQCDTSQANPQCETSQANLQCETSQANHQCETSQANPQCETSQTNLLAFLYIKSGFSNKAKPLVDRLIASSPDNVLAQVNKFHWALAKQRPAVARAVMMRLEQTPPSDANLAIALGELAFCLSALPERYHAHALRLYRTVIKTHPDTRTLTHFPSENGAAGGSQNSPSNESFNSVPPAVLVSWCFGLADLYHKMLEKSYLYSICKGLPALGSLDIHTHFRHLCNLLHFVTEHDHSVYRGRAYVVMGDAQQRYELISDASQTLMALPWQLTCDDCFRKAAELSPNDPYVSAWCGRYYRQRARSDKDFHRVRVQLEQAVRVDPSNHFAHHQLSLTYRALWIIVRKFKERFLFIQRSNGRHNRTPLGETRRSGRTRPATFPNDVSKLQRQHHRPDYMDVLRTSNPTDVHPETPHDYLRLAVMEAEAACEISKNTRCFYEIDRARLYVSLGQLEKAEDVLLRAGDVARTDSEVAYLYEQLGLLRHRMMESVSEEQDREEILEDVKDHYMTAVWRCVSCKKRSRVAFFKLLDILRDQMEARDERSDVDISSLWGENALLHNWMEKFPKAEAALIEALRNDPDQLQILQRLIQTLMLQNKVTAAMEHLRGFLEAIAANRSLPWIDRHLPLTVSLAAARVSHGDHRVSLLRDIFHWYLPQPTGVAESLVSMFVNRDAASAADPLCDVDILVFASEMDDQMTSRLVRTLRDQCGLRLFVTATGGNSDMLNLPLSIPCQLVGFDYIAQRVRRFRAVLLMQKDIMEDETLHLGVAGCICALTSMRGVCRLLHSSSDNVSVASSPSLNTLPAVYIQDDMLDEQFIEELFRQLFQCT